MRNIEEILSLLGMALWAGVFIVGQDSVKLLGQY